MKNNRGATPAPCACMPGGQRAQAGVSQEAIDTFPLGMAYVPWQTWGRIFNCPDALAAGTLFPDLYMPYSGGRGICHD